MRDLERPWCLSVDCDVLPCGDRAEPMQKRETLVGVLDKAIAILQVFSPEETILTPTREGKPNASLLAHCLSSATKGYYVVRRDCYMDTPPNERICTDSEPLEELCQIALDIRHAGPWPVRAK